MVLIDEVDGSTGAQQQGTSSTQIGLVDHNHPLFIHSSDTQASVLILVQVLKTIPYGVNPSNLYF